MPADLAAGFEVDQVEGFAELDMVLDRELESPRRSNPAELAAVVLGDPDGGVGMGQVGNSPQALFDLVVHDPELIFLIADHGLEAFAFLDQRGPLFGIFLTAGGLGHLVLAAADLLHDRQQPLALGLERDHPIDILQHVVGDIPVAAVLPHRFGIGDDVFEIEHGFALNNQFRGRGRVSQEKSQFMPGA